MKRKRTKPYNLNALVKTYDIDNLYEQYKRREFLQKLGIYKTLTKSSVLELGSATGRMTAMLARVAAEVVAIDGSSYFIRIAQEHVNYSKKVTFCESYFEDFSIDKKFDCIVLHHILEHVENPDFLLTRYADFLKRDGVIAVSVPNAHALSRQLAVKMNLLSSLYMLTANDMHHGHMRVYDWQMLENQIERNGLEIIGKHGLSLKLFSDKQNVEMLNANIIGEKQLKGLWQLGDNFPQIAGAIMIVARIRKPKS